MGQADPEGAAGPLKFLAEETGVHCLFCLSVLLLFGGEGVVRSHSSGDTRLTLL